MKLEPLKQIKNIHTGVKFKNNKAPTDGNRNYISWLKKQSRLLKAKGRSDLAEYIELVLAIKNIKNRNKGIK